jgi:hypothetical protein
VGCERPADHVVRQVHRILVGERSRDHGINTASSEICAGHGEVAAHKALAVAASPQQPDHHVEPDRGEDVPRWPLSPPRCHRP